MVITLMVGLEEEVKRKQKRNNTDDQLFTRALLTDVSQWKTKSEQNVYKDSLVGH